MNGIKYTNCVFQNELIKVRKGVANSLLSIGFIAAR